MVMRTRGCRWTLYALVLTVTFIRLLSGRAAAQQEFDLPRQPTQAYASPSPMATPIPHRSPGSDVRTLPQISEQPSSPAPSAAFQPPRYESQPQHPPSSQVQPVLPAVFRGCWEGRVDYLDSLKRLPGAAKVGFWTAKTYRLCYRRIGDGPFVLTFSEAGIEQNNRIAHAAGRMTLLSSDGRRYASMRSDLDFDEYRSHASYFGNNTFAVHELADLDCDIEPDGMHVKGMVTGWRNSVPWFRARWHTVLTHQSEPPQQVEAPPGGIPE
jgi:hypothetical protein